MFSLLFPKTKKELALVFDIGSSSVGGSIFEMEKNGIPKIISSIREPINPKEALNPNQLFLSMIKSLGIVVNEIYSQGLGAPSRIFCVLSSPWHASQTRIVKLEKNISFIFNTKLANSLIKKEIALFEEDYLAKYKNSKNSVRPIEFKNIKIMLNGYETFKPLNQKTKELEMTVFISISPEQVLGKIEETIRKHFQFKEIKFSSSIIASFTVVRDLYTDDENFLLVDVGGEITHISMIKKNTLREFTSFPLGINFIIRGVATALNSSLDEAKSFISLLKNGHATDSVIQQLELTINKLKTEWLQKFQESLASLSNDISIPSIIYVTTEKDFMDFFCETIKTEQFNQYSFTESKFKVFSLNSEVFHGMALFEKNTIRDDNIIIDAIYINRFLNEK